MRRTWPRSLIGWTRLLAGRFRDPMVGREVLFGTIIGIVAYQGYWLSAALGLRLGHTTTYFARETALDPIRTFAGDRLIGLVVAIELAIGTTFIYLLFRRRSAGPAASSPSGP